jgi:FkbM family methyltransferase
MLLKSSIDDIEGGFNFIDIGCSGGLDIKWKSLSQWINLYGFDPNKLECERLNKVAHDFHSATYLPYAIGDTDGEKNLFITESISCNSLLEPNNKWLKRFIFDHLFEVTGVERVPTRKLSNIPELKNLDVDIIKVDSQGLDLAILANAGPMLEGAIYIESEPGFTENYIGENTYAQIDSFLRANHFLLFDLKFNRIPRKNVIGETNKEKAQLLWCESIWLKDYIQLEKETGLKWLTRGKALKSLILCAMVGCFDFGYELAELYHSKGLLGEDELTELMNVDGWVVVKNDEEKVLAFFSELVGLTVRLLPGKFRRAVARSVDESAGKPHLLRSLMGLYKGRPAEDGG